MNDPYECLHCLGVMLGADNAQAIVFVRRAFPILNEEDDLILALTLLRVLHRYGQRRDLALLPGIVSERLLAGLGPSRSRLEEALQRTRARLLTASNATSPPPAGARAAESGSDPLDVVLRRTAALLADLTGDQKAKITAIRKEMHEKIKAAETAGAKRAIVREMREKIDAVLTDEQRAKLRKEMLEHKRRRAAAE